MRQLTLSHRRLTSVVEQVVSILFFLKLFIIEVFMSGNSSSSSSSSGGIGFVGLLTILFVGLKLTNNIDWSWWWVLSPIWISTIIIALIVVGVGIFSLRS